MTGPPTEAVRAEQGDGFPPTASDGSPIGFVVIDYDGRVLQFSAVAEEMFGYTEEEVLGATLAELIIPRHLWAAHEAGLARFRETGTGPLFDHTFEVPAVTKDGRDLRVQLSVSAMRLRGRDVVVGAVRRAQSAPVVPAELRLSVDFYRAVVEGATLLVLVVSDGAVRWASPAVERLLGPGVAGEPVAALCGRLHPDDQAVAQAAADGGAVADPVEVRLRGAGGEWHAVSFVAAVLDDHPAVAGTVYYGTDVTRARAAELNERVTSLQLLTLINSLAEAVLVEDDDGCIQLANPALVDMFGLGVGPPALAGHRLSGPPPPGVPGYGWQVLGRVSCHIGRGSLELHLDDGRVLERTCTPISGDRAVRGQLWVFRDVTAAVEARRALQEHNERLAALSALKSEFIAIVSHELRTPLTSISAFTEMLGGPGELTSTDAPAAVAAIARNTDRMLVLVQDLILLSRLETGDQSVATGAVDIADLAREVGDAIGTGGQAVAVRLEITDGPLLEGDERLLRQLVHTIVGTVAACAVGDAVTLRAYADGTGWTVTATAPTDEFITGEQLLAAPLAVLDDASRQRSAALSVLLARAIAHSHGGMLLVEVEPAAEATITVRLPLATRRHPPAEPRNEVPALDHGGAVGL